MLARRNFLRALPAAPFVAKRAAEDAAANLARIGSSVGDASVPPSAVSDGGINAAQWRSILSTVAGREQARAILIEEERHVSRIDPDLAVLKSISLSAKIAYQRDRNVERRLDAMQNEWSWRRLESLGKKLAGL